MRHLLLLAALLITSLAALPASKPEPARGSAGILELSLPESVSPPPWAPEQLSKLEIDGTDRSTPRLTKRTLKVDPKPGADTVTVVYTFWPNVYTRISRTKVVKVEKGETVKVSFASADPGRPDKIVVAYVPTPQPVVEAMAKLARIGKDDVVYDIGCGDGRMVIHAVKSCGAKRGVGIDISAERIKESKENARKAGVSDRVTFLHRDALSVKDFSEASVVMLYMSEVLNKALRPALQKTLKPGARIVSHRFRIGDWEPDKTETLFAKDNQGDDSVFELHLWTIKKRP